MIVVWRGTAGMDDVFTDMTFKPVKLQADMGVKGYVHSGFYNCFKTMDSDYPLRIKSNPGKESILDIINDLASNRKLFIAGHSLGGALALLHATKLRKYNPVLYTVGMPRVLTISVAEQLEDIIHHRHVNENDAVPALPFEKDMNNFAFKENNDLLGYSIEIALTYADWKTKGLS
ncbi:lipase family protein, partial [Providencia rettgeri]